MCASFIILSLAALGFSGCNRRDGECSALRRTIDAASVDAGDAPHGIMAAAERAVAELDRVHAESPDLQRYATDYRAALVGVATAARGVEADRNALFESMRPLGKPVAGALAEMGTVSEHVTALMKPCLLRGLEHAFDRPEAGVDPAPPDCAKVEALCAQITTPAPQVSLSAHLLGCAGALEGAEVVDPAMKEAARGLAGIMRGIEPTFREIKTPAAEVFARVSRMGEQQRGLQTARAKAAERAAEISSACPRG
ncbi:Hypothetical protein A7982_01339 [Minicystis rosea]|nr:Hypothetical protein A7982_01339 [Minicystis rosea]